MERQKRRLAYLLITPAALWLLIFIGAPILDTIRTSFYRTTYLGDKFAGLFNYALLPGDEVFWLIVRNSVLWTAGAVLLNVGLGLLVALLLSRPTLLSEITAARWCWPGPRRSSWPPLPGNGCITASTASSTRCCCGYS